MPELPDITAYIVALEPRIIGKRLEHVRLGTPFLLAPQSRRSPTPKAARFVSYAASESASRSASTAICGSCCT